MINIAKIAKLSNLPGVNPADYEGKLEETIKFVEVLKELNTDKISPTFQVGNNVNVWREDKIQLDRIIPAKKYQSKVVWN